MHNYLNVSGFVTTYTSTLFSKHKCYVFYAVCAFPFGVKLQKHK
jgi:hypothetical protein